MEDMLNVVTDVVGYRDVGAEAVAIGRYRAVSRAVVRQGPALDSPRVGRLEIGQEFDAIAQETLGAEMPSGSRDIGPAVRLKFVDPEIGNVWVSEKGKTGKVLLEKQGIEYPEAPPIRVTDEGTTKGKKFGDPIYHFGVFIGDERVHTIHGSYDQLAEFKSVPDLIFFEALGKWGVTAAELRFPGRPSNASQASTKKCSREMRVFFAAILEDNDCKQGSKVDRVHAALKIDPGTREKDLPGPVSQRLIDAAAYRHGQKLAAKRAAENYIAATRIQASFRGNQARSGVAAAKSKAVSSLQSAMEPLLKTIGCEWKDAEKVFKVVFGGFNVIRTIIRLETLPIKIAVAVVMEGIRPELEPILQEKGIEWDAAVNMVVRAGTLPITCQTGGVTGDNKAMEEINSLAQDPKQFAHGLLAASGAASKRIVPAKFHKHLDSYLIHEEYLLLYKQAQDGHVADSFDGKLYIDDFLPTDARAKRPGRGEGLLDHVPALCLFRNIEPEDLRNSPLGHVWLTAALSAVAEMPDHIYRLFGDQSTLASNGRYDIELFHPANSEWVTVSVDDRIPVELSGGIEYMPPTAEVELWPCLLEKAIAKLFGGYEAMDETKETCGFPGLGHGVGPSLALEILTGRTAVEIFWEDGKWTCHMEDQGEMVMIPWPDTLSEAARDTNDIMHLLEMFDQKGCIMVADDHEKNGSYFERAKANREAGLLETFGFIQKNGLVDCHAYSLLEVRHDIEGFDECDLVKMRNPWGGTEWKGAWSDTSSEWQTHQQVKQAVGFQAGTDGVFWMSTADFARHFRAVHVSLSDEALIEVQERARIAREQSSTGNEESDDGNGAELRKRSRTLTRAISSAAPRADQIHHMTWILHAGELRKKKGITPKWQDEFCIVEAGLLKRYTCDGPGGTQIGMIKLEAATTRPDNSATPNGTQEGFEIVTGDRTFRFRAKSQEDRDAWVSALLKSTEHAEMHKLPRAMKIEEGGRAGGKFGRWSVYHFDIREMVGGNGAAVKRLLVFDNLHTEKDKYFQARIHHCTVSFPKTTRLRHEYAFRIDTKKGRKLIIDPGTKKDRDAWITHLHRCGARTPEEYWAKHTDHDEEHE